MTEEKEKKKMRTYTTPILVTLAVIVAFLAGMFVIKYLGGEKTGEQEEKAGPTPTEEAVLGEELSTTIGRFSVTEDELCQENDKPIVYFFGSKSCPHCTWEHPIFDKAMAKFGNLISLHNNMDEPEEDQEIFQQYSQINRGGIPFLVLGCRYARVGSGENYGEEQEENYLTALICQLTEGEPEEVCEEVSDLIEEIEE